MKKLSMTILFVLVLAGGGVLSCSNAAGENGSEGTPSHKYIGTWKGSYEISAEFTVDGHTQSTGTITHTMTVGENNVIISSVFTPSNPGMSSEESDDMEYKYDYTDKELKVYEEGHPNSSMTYTWKENGTLECEVLINYENNNLVFGTCIFSKI